MYSGLNIDIFIILVVAILVVYKGVFLLNLPQPAYWMENVISWIISSRIIWEESHERLMRPDNSIDPIVWNNLLVSCCLRSLGWLSMLLRPCVWFGGLGPQENVCLLWHWICILISGVVDQYCLKAASLTLSCLTRQSSFSLYLYKYENIHLEKYRRYKTTVLFFMYHFSDR